WGYAVQTGGASSRDGRVTPGTIRKVLDLGAGDVPLAAAAAEVPGVARGRPFTLEITAEGDVVRTAVNGRPAARLVDPAGAFRRGPIRFLARPGTVAR